MKINELFEATPEIDPNSNLMKPGFQNIPAINGTRIDPVLRRGIVKLAQGKKMQRIEATKVIETFVSLIQMEPARIPTMVRVLKALYVQASKTK